MRRIPRSSRGSARRPAAARHSTNRWCPLPLSSGARGGADEPRYRTDPEHLFPSGPASRRVGVEGALDYEGGHLFDDMREIEVGDAIPLEVGRRIQIVDRVRHTVLDRKLNRVHLVAERLIDRLRVA